MYHSDVRWSEFILWHNYPPSGTRIWHIMSRSIETLRPRIHVTPTDFLTREHGDIDAEDGL